MRLLGALLLIAVTAGTAVAQNMPYTPTDFSKLKGVRSPGLGFICGPSEGGIWCGEKYICAPLGASCCSAKGGKLIYCPNGYSCKAGGRCTR
jgi:hypothetical protein